MKIIVKASLIAAVVLSLSACSLFEKDSDSSNTTTPVVTHSGITQPQAKDTSTNNMAWTDITGKLPRDFPEITLNGSSNVNNVVSQYNITSVIWTNATKDNVTEVQKFLEEKLSTKFETDGDVITASDVVISRTKYAISLSFSEGKPNMLSMNVTMVDSNSAGAATQAAQ